LKFARAILKIRRGHLLGRGCVVSWGGGWVGLLCPPSPRIQKKFLREKNQPPHDENHFPYLVPYNPLLIRVRHFPVFQNDFKTRVTSGISGPLGIYPIILQMRAMIAGDTGPTRCSFFCMALTLSKLFFFLKEKFLVCCVQARYEGGPSAGPHEGNPRRGRGW